MRRPLVSVVMLSWNHEAYVSAAIESVLAQSEGDLELMVIDDASSDASPAIIRSLEARDHRIEALFHAENLGIAKSVNEGLRAARGEYVALFSSDDLWKPDKLERQMDVLKRAPGAVVWSEGMVIDRHGAPTGELFTQRFGPYGRRKKSGDIFDDLCRSNYIYGESLVTHRENLAGISFDTSLKYLNDYKANLALASRFPFRFIEEPLAMYRIHGENSILRDAQGWTRDQALLWSRLHQDPAIAKRLTRAAEHGFLGLSSRGYAALGDRRRAWMMFGKAIWARPTAAKNLFLLCIVVLSHFPSSYLAVKSAYRRTKRLLLALFPVKRK